jgi:transposase
VEDGTTTPPQGERSRASGFQANFATSLTENDVSLVVCVDEGRFGPKPGFRRRWCPLGKRPPWLVEEKYEWLWLYAAVEPRTGACFFLMLPAVNGDCFELFLRELSKTEMVKPGARVGVVMDNAGAHRSGSVEWPEQFVPMALPPYSPELNPVEQVFRQLRGWLSNRVFDSLDQMGDVLIEEIREFWENPQVLVRLTYYPWWRQAIENIPS